MITILADTSALISLEIKGPVSQASKPVQFIISTAVYDELIGIARFEDVHGRSAKDLLRLIVDGGCHITWCSSAGPNFAVQYAIFPARYANIPRNVRYLCFISPG